MVAKPTQRTRKGACPGVAVSATRIASVPLPIRMTCFAMVNPPKRSIVEREFIPVGVVLGIRVDLEISRQIVDADVERKRVQ